MGDRAVSGSPEPVIRGWGLKGPGTGKSVAVTTGGHSFSIEDKELYECALQALKEIAGSVEKQGEGISLNIAKFSSALISLETLTPENLQQMDFKQLATLQTAVKAAKEAISRLKGDSPGTVAFQRIGNLIAYQISIRSLENFAKILSTDSQDKAKILQINRYIAGALDEQSISSMDSEQLQSLKRAIQTVVDQMEKAKVPATAKGMYSKLLAMISSAEEKQNSEGAVGGFFDQSVKELSQTSGSTVPKRAQQEPVPQQSSTKEYSGSSGYISRLKDCGDDSKAIEEQLGGFFTAISEEDSGKQKTEALKLFMECPQLRSYSIFLEGFKKIFGEEEWMHISAALDFVDKISTEKDVKGKIDTLLSHIGSLTQYSQIAGYLIAKIANSALKDIPEYKQLLHSLMHPPKAAASEVSANPVQGPKVSGDKKSLLQKLQAGDKLVLVNGELKAVHRSRLGEIDRTISNLLSRTPIGTVGKSSTSETAFEKLLSVLEGGEPLTSEEMTILHESEWVQGILKQHSDLKKKLRGLSVVRPSFTQGTKFSEHADALFAAVKKGSIEDFKNRLTTICSEGGTLKTQEEFKEFQKLVYYAEDLARQVALGESDKELPIAVAKMRIVLEQLPFVPDPVPSGTRIDVTTEIVALETHEGPEFRKKRAFSG